MEKSVPARGIMVKPEIKIKRPDLSKSFIFSLPNSGLVRRISTTKIKKIMPPTKNWNIEERPANKNAQPFFLRK
ncbi:MAG: hypothetical protein AB1668_00550 [Nanoarchaeota archaeon]